MTAGPRHEGHGSAGDELVEVLGSDGSIVDVVTRRRMRAEGLAHRATFVITLLSPPPAGDDDGESTPEAVDAWFGGIRWPIIEPGGDRGPELAPRALGRPVSLSPDAPVVVHRRADWKDVYPGYWDLAFGGVCAVGESWLESAERELTEEAGLPTKTSVPSAQTPVLVTATGAGRYRDEQTDTFGGLFLAFSPAEPDPADGEVVAIDYIPAGEIASWATSRLVSSDSRAMVVSIISALVGASDQHR